MGMLRAVRHFVVAPIILSAIAALAYTPAAAEPTGLSPTASGATTLSTTTATQTSTTTPTASPSPAATQTGVGSPTPTAALTAGGGNEVRDRFGHEFADVDGDLDSDRFRHVAYAIDRVAHRCHGSDTNSLAGSHLSPPSESPWLHVRDACVDRER